jgi:hypothetical protein
MPLTQHLPFTRPRRTRAARSQSHERPRPAPAPDLPQIPHGRAKATRGGGPQDRALYNCGCGYVFTAAVTTSVGCPHCGTVQAW